MIAQGDLALGATMSATMSTFHPGQEAACVTVQTWIERIKYGQNIEA